MSIGTVHSSLQVLLDGTEISLDLMEDDDAWCFAWWRGAEVAMRTGSAKSRLAFRENARTAAVADAVAALGRPVGGRRTHVRGGVVAMDAKPLREIHRKVVLALQDAERQSAAEEAEMLTTALNIAHAMFKSEADRDDDIIDTPLIENFLDAVTAAKKQFPHLDV